MNGKSGIGRTKYKGSKEKERNRKLQEPIQHRKTRQ